MAPIVNASEATARRCVRELERPHPSIWIPSPSPPPGQHDPCRSEQVEIGRSGGIGAGRSSRDGATDQRQHVPFRRTYGRSGLRSKACSKGHGTRRYDNLSCSGTKPIRKGARAGNALCSGTFADATESEYELLGGLDSRATNRRGVALTLLPMRALRCVLSAPSRSLRSTLRSSRRARIRLAVWRRICKVPGRRRLAPTRSRIRYWSVRALPPSSRFPMTSIGKRGFRR